MENEITKRPWETPMVMDLDINMSSKSISSPVESKFPGTPAGPS